jgi:tryptophan halogenase
MKITIVGGGTAGLVCALILKKHLDIDVEIVYSQSIGIIGVGEGSTEHFSEFMKFVGIDSRDMIKKTNATYKSGVMFEGWSEKPYLHSISPSFASKQGQYSCVYAKQISENSSYLTPKTLWKNKINEWFLYNEEEEPTNQYHFDTYKLNEYLTNFAKEKYNIKMYEDTINEVVIGESGNIEKIIGNKKEYCSDFYIDSTGFRRLLIGKLGAQWVSYSKHLKMNSAITFQTPDEDNYNIWTLSKAMNNGWMFRIPTFGRHGNGYIYDKNYTNEDSVKQEIKSLFNFEINFGKTFFFDPGALKDPWIKNCCAIGLSSNFVEPLEASSIGTSIQQSFLLMHRLVNYTEITRKNYNKSFTDITENIRDFIFMHYITNKTNTQFWKDVKNMEYPNYFAEKLEGWKRKLPIREDFNNVSDYILFTENHHILVMEGLGLFNKESIKKEYLATNKLIKNFADSKISEYKNFENSIKTITHKDFLSRVRYTL